MLTLKSSRSGSPNARSSSSSISAGSSSATPRCSGRAVAERRSQRREQRRARSGRAADAGGRRRRGTTSGPSRVREVSSSSGVTNGMSQPHDEHRPPGRALERRRRSGSGMRRARRARARPAPSSSRQRRVALRHHDRLDARARERGERVRDQRPAAELEGRLRLARSACPTAREHAPIGSRRLYPRAERRSLR